MFLSLVFNGAIYVSTAPITGVNHKSIVSHLHVIIFYRTAIAKNNVVPEKKRRVIKTKTSAIWNGKWLHHNNIDTLMAIYNVQRTIP